MVNEKIKIKTENGQTLEVVVLNKNANRIEVVLGEGVHSVRAAMTPTRNEMAYAGQIMGREIVYERSRAQVQADIDKLDPRLKKSR
jgi:K+/H+ antiporter YhaU regulatory subunit KhtT